ncbi:Uncharacterised protein [Stenotrophomonas maltophilia]|nr:Uncharacterised protein [Stenotrophomonas maltophilia]
MLGGDARPAQQIATLAGDVDGHAAVVPLGQADLLRLQLAGFLQAAQLQRQQLRGGDAAGHFGQLDLRALRGRQRAAEQHAFLGVAQRFIQAGNRRADRAPADAVTGLGQAAQRSLQALHVRQAVAVGHAHVVEEQRTGQRRAQAHLVLDFLRGEAGHALLQHEALDAVLGLRPDDGQVGHRAAGDPHLAAADAPVIAVAHRTGLHAGRIGTAVRFSQAETADQFAACHRRQPLLALFLAAIGVDRVHAQRALHRHEAAQAGIAALQLLADQAVADRTEVATAVLRRQGRAEQAQRSDLRHQFIGEAGLVEGIADDRQHALVGEAGHALLHCALFLVEQGTDIEQIVRMQSHGTHTQSGPGHCRSFGAGTLRCAAAIVR